eukprot:CAMPEP_0117052446 /NCGR_PEP_ID=MMETSP0472-20121206/36256_1 /TAXON_ID=693140 ORGANISM="Tiarina fusus, Strain LIS" /NCGR_SAMPLE_ID=MMETSP0472 /ASSEMBLY_ACC=CAM_ASM_000603 /LENGTH=185 /DNA_ID=CAMNT_0004767083 /DNA_START=48 /DNA_END=605 /DNA_ORIENTATION=-
MAPRYPSLSDYSSSDYPVLDSTLEFKPRLDLWASQTAYDAWTKPQQQQQQQSQSMQTKKRVRFSATLTKSKAHTSLSEFTSEEKEACWFSRHEFRTMRQERQYTIDSSPNLNEEWGLETSGNNSIYYEIRQAQNAVLEEQDDQLRWDGYLNADILSARYMAYTAASKDRAQWLGNHHAKEAAILK